MVSCSHAPWLEKVLSKKWLFTRSEVGGLGRFGPGLGALPILHPANTSISGLNYLELDDAAYSSPVCMTYQARRSLRSAKTWERDHLETLHTIYGRNLTVVQKNHPHRISHGTVVRKFLPCPSGNYSMLYPLTPPYFCYRSLT